MFRLVLGGGVAFALVLSVMAAPVAAADQTPRHVIFAYDNCDPATFNAIRPGSCVGSGHTTVQQFNQQLQLLHQVPLWRFIPDRIHVDAGEPFRVANIGGETHTFTEVAQFGGGFVPQLNQAAGNLTPRPECGAPPGPDNHFLAPGQSVVISEDQPGTHLYQCCIHPWMHAVLKVREQEASRD